MAEHNSKVWVREEQDGTSDQVPASEWHWEADCSCGKSWTASSADLIVDAVMRHARA